MAVSRWCRVFALCGALSAWALLLPTARACPFCQDERGPTLLGDYNQATLVLYGRFTNPRLDKDGGFEGGTTDFVLEQVLKPHALVKDKKMITLPRYVPATRSKFLIFCDVYKGAIDPYRGVEVQGKSDLVGYLTGAMAKKDRPIAERLRYCFDFLNSNDLEVSLDAYREYAKADYGDYKEMARKLPAEKLAGWLKDPKTPPYRFGLYASLLGHCGTAEHAKLLRAMITDPDKNTGSGIDGMLAGYIMLAPQEGWAYLKNDLLGKQREDFLLRYAGLRTVRFFWETRPDLVAQKEMVAGVCQLLDHPDIADFAIEDLRKWKRWETADRVLDVMKKKSHDVPAIRRSVLHYALSCRQIPRADTFVREMIKLDREWVEDNEELLKLENEAPVTPKKTPKTK